MVKIKEIKGYTFDDEKWEKLKSQWKDLKNGVYECPKHKTIFVYEQEPCWQCWDSCYKEVK
jgi:hypothetical protein